MKVLTTAASLTARRVGARRTPSTVSTGKLVAQRSLSSVAVAGPSKLGRRTAEGSLPGRVTAENAGIRSFSSYNMPGPAKGLPTYSIWAEESMLSLKLIPPAFRANRSGLYVDPKRQGKIIFEFTPRKSDEMRFDWDSKTVIALSPEEVGLVCSQLPHSEVSFVRKAVTPEGGDFGEPVAANLPDRVMTITPVDGGAVRFHIDFVKDGLGGQGPGIGQRGNDEAIEVVAQAGEFQVALSILQHSIPFLVGWASLQQMTGEFKMRFPDDRGPRPPF